MPTQSHTLVDSWLMERADRLTVDLVTTCTLRGAWSKFPREQVVKVSKAAIALQKAMAELRQVTGIQREESRETT